MNRPMTMVLAILAGLAIGLVGLGQAQAGLNAVQTVTETTDADSSKAKRVSVECPNAEDFRSGGGAHVKGGGSDVAIVSTRPAGTAAWKAKAVEVSRTGDDWSLKVYALCLNN